MKTIIANWKMRVGVRESVALARGTLLTVRGKKVIPEIVVCPPFVALSEVRKVVARSAASLGAQNMNEEESGAFTGETSARMLIEMGVTHVIIGHSERRQMFCETDEMVNAKVKQAISNQLVPIVCVGETLEQRDAGEARDVVRDQLASGLNDVRLRGANKLLVAYEPLWSIGTGRAAIVGDVLEMHEYVRDVLSGIFPEAAEGQVQILYGGSVDGENAYQFLREKLVDGVLVGAASVKLNQFREIVSAAVEVMEGLQE
jgi:triosephosphate isomerase (TIM)